MLNYIWFFMIVIGVIYGFITGNIEKVGSGAIESATEAVKLCITMVGIMSMWMGFMEVARTSGLIRKAEKRLDPVVSWLFPNIPKNHPALASITTNIIANILGLGWAATPAGLKAMEELSAKPVEQKGGNLPAYMATDEMCTFLVVNISSLQLIPVNIIAYRSQYGSANPAAIVGPAIIATTISTLVGVIWCKIKCKGRIRNN